MIKQNVAKSIRQRPVDQEQDITISPISDDISDIKISAGPKSRDVDPKSENHHHPNFEIKISECSGPKSRK